MTPTQPTYLLSFPELPCLTHEQEIELGTIIQSERQALKAGRPLKADATDSLSGSPTDGSLATSHSPAWVAARTKLIEHNYRLVMWAAKSSKTKSVEDAFQDGIIALCNAVEGYDPAEGVRFSTYASRVIRNTMYRNDRMQYEEFRRLESGLTCGPTNDDGFSIEHVADDRDRETYFEREAREEERVAVRAALDLLTENERVVVEQRYGGKVTSYKEIGRILGLSRERIRQIEQIATTKIKFCVAIRLSPKQRWPQTG